MAKKQTENIKQTETVLLRFLKARGYMGQKILAGQEVEVNTFWASVFIKDGSAEEVKADGKS